MAAIKATDINSYMQLNHSNAPFWRICTGTGAAMSVLFKCDDPATADAEQALNQLNSAVQMLQPGSYRLEVCDGDRVKESATGTVVQWNNCKDKVMFTKDGAAQPTQTVGAYTPWGVMSGGQMGMHNFNQMYMLRSDHAREMQNAELQYKLLTRLEMLENAPETDPQERVYEMVEKLGPHIIEKLFPNRQIAGVAGGIGPEQETVIDWGEASQPATETSQPGETSEETEQKLPSPWWQNEEHLTQAISALNKLMPHFNNNPVAMIAKLHLLADKVNKTPMLIDML